MLGDLIDPVRCLTQLPDPGGVGAHPKGDGWRRGNAQLGDLSLDFSLRSANSLLRCLGLANVPFWAPLPSAVRQQALIFYDSRSLPLHPVSQETLEFKFFFSILIILTFRSYILFSATFYLPP